MRKALGFISLVLAVSAYAQHDMPSMHGMGTERLRSGLGAVHHSVSTRNPDAQRFFDQGLALYYGFNHTASARSFMQAYTLDPHLAIAHWGVALALGPNINSDVTPEREKQAFAEIQQAKSLEGSASPEEKALIDALAARYTNEEKPDLTKLATAYRAAMGDVTKAYPTDPDAATLYAESIMDLRPWRLWSADGKPEEGTEECIGVLKGVLKDNPLHIGANHFLIHAVEASPHPEDALVSAHRLDVLAPNSGHLVHMPSHTYIRTGDYHRGVLANEHALAVDAAYLEKTKDAGGYPMYYMHNFDMLRHAANMEGNFTRSQWAADQLTEKSKHMQGMPPMDGFGSIPALNMVRFRQWDAVLARPEYKGDPSSSALVHFARGMAFAGKNDASAATGELAAMRESAKAVGADTVWMFTPMSTVIGISEHLLNARIARVAGDHEKEISELQAAVEAQGQVGYDEPPDYFFPTRESLGGALLRAGKAAQAEAVFRADLAKNPGNGRSLYGLSEALKGQGKKDEAARSQRDYKQAWQWADTKLSVDSL